MMFGLARSTAVHLIEADRPTLVDAGAAATAPTVIGALDRLGMKRIDAIALTHIHFDHAGGTGQLLQRFPDARVYVPERVAAHLVDPTRLIEGVKSVWGEQTEQLFGLPLPVAEERIIPVAGGDRIDLGDRELSVLATPGHTRAHVSYLDDKSGSLFCGDALGIHLPSLEVVRPATPPADFSLEDALASIELIRGAGADHLLIGHFGLVAGEPDLVCDRAAAALNDWWEIFERERLEAEGSEDLLRRVHCALEAGTEPALPGQRRLLETVNPAWLNISGMTMASERVRSGT